MENNSIRKVRKTQVDNAQDIDIVIPMCDLIEYSEAYSKISGSLLQYYRDEPAIDKNINIINFPANNNNNILFKFKQKITGQTEIGITKKCENNAFIKIILK